MNTHSASGKEGVFNAFLTLLIYRHWLTLGGPKSSIGHEQCQHTRSTRATQQQISTSCVVCAATTAVNTHNALL